MRFAALLRGVNVGGKNRVPMGELRELLGELGFTDVETLLNSGNAVFTSGGRSPRAHAAKIQEALAKALGVNVRVIVKSSKEIDAALAENPIRKPASDASKLLVGFAQDDGDLRALEALEALLTPDEILHVGNHAVYFFIGAGFRDSKAAAALLGRAGQAVTTRNLATVQKLAAMLAGGAPAGGKGGR